MAARMKLPTVPSMGVIRRHSAARTPAISSKLTLTMRSLKKRPQTYHALSCIACGGTHLVDLVTGEALMPRERRECPIHEQRRLSRSGTKLLSFSYRSLRLPLRRKARAVLPSVEAVCTGCWLGKIMEPAIMPTKKATATMSIISPTGFGNG